MYNKSTEELEKQLEHTHPENISQYIEGNAEEILTEDRAFMRYMNEKFKEKGVQKQQVFLKADISQGYGYKLLTQEKTTKQRDVILRICYAAEFTLPEVQQALKLYRMDTLYARDTRDALIIAAFNNRPGSVIELNEYLLRNNLPALRSSGIQD